MHILTKAKSDRALMDTLALLQPTSDDWSSILLFISPSLMYSHARFLPMLFSLFSTMTNPLFLLQSEGEGSSKNCRVGNTGFSASCGFPF